MTRRADVLALHKSIGEQALRSTALPSRATPLYKSLFTEIGAFMYLSRTLNQGKAYALGVREQNAFC